MRISFWNPNMVEIALPCGSYWHLENYVCVTDRCVSCIAASWKGLKHCKGCNAICHGSSSDPIPVVVTTSHMNLCGSKVVTLMSMFPSYKTKHIIFPEYGKAHPRYSFTIFSFSFDIAKYFRKHIACLYLYRIRIFLSLSNRSCLAWVSFPVCTTLCYYNLNLKLMTTHFSFLYFSFSLSRLHPA